ncbi:MAG TPA: carboxypeptidase regulatory-like domain-containing protein [Thermoanaerobaculia bacterium]|nr:carboxypeptidase regulatory-like domain-containing protein [Thermoanaerobaculia bacterium]
MKRALIFGSILLVALGVSFASVLLRRHSNAVAPVSAASKAAGLPTPAERPAVKAEPLGSVASTRVAATQKRGIPRKRRAIASRKPIAAVETEAYRAAGGPRAGGAAPAGVGEDEEKPPRAPATPESLALWTYREGDPITPVLSPELRNIAPIEGSRDEQRVVENERLPYRGESPGRRPVVPDGALQPSFGVNAPTPTGVNFAGIGVNGSAPSDDNGRVGPNNYIQTVNSQFAVYSKTGTLQFGPANINTLFSSLSGPCKTQNNGDPIVQYDALADRWILSQFAVNALPTGLASYQCMAISKTGDPLGAYYLYPFPLSPVLFFDYPHVVTWPDGYYATYHVFDETKPTAQQYQNQGLVVFERDMMLVGLPARLINKSIGTPGAQEFFGGQATDLDGLTPPPPGSQEYLFIPGSPEWDGSSAPMIHSFKLATVWGGSPGVTVTGPTNILTASFTTNLCNFSRTCVPQPPPSGSADKFDPITGEFMSRAAYRNNGGTESIMLVHTVNALVPTANQGATRWYEIRTPATTPTIFQQGTFAPDTDWRVVGSIAMDNGGNVALGYTKSSATVFPEIDVTGRLAGDPAGTMGAEVVMQPGVGAQIATANRWGDYSGMSVDARDGCTFWYTTQYIPVTGSFTWGSRIAAFKFAPANCSAPLQGTLSGTVTDQTGAPVAGAIVKLDNGFSGATNGSGNYSIVLPPGGTNAIASAPQRPGCNNSASTPVTITNGSTTTQDFVLGGNALFVAGPVVIDDTNGNNNGHINHDECVVLDVPLDDLGCNGATGISAVLSTSTPGVTVTQASATYPNVTPGARVVNTPRYKISTSSSLVCGTPISFTLTVSSSAGSQPVLFTVPTCDTPTTVAGAITAGDPTQTARLSRGGLISSCGATATCPLTTGTGTRHYDSYTYTNTAATSKCVTVEVSPNCAEVGGQIFSAAYLGSFNPASLCTNYLGDPGTSPANGGTSQYAFDVPAGATFVVVVHEVNQNVFCSAYTLKVSGLDDTSGGGRPSATITAPSSFCASSTGNTASVPDAGPGATYVWTLSGGSITGGQGTRTLTFSAAASGSVVLGVTVTSSTGCVSTGSATLPITACGAGRAFFTLPPCRVLDTRNPTGAYGGPSLAGGATRTFTIAGQCGVPLTATAIAVNFTVTGSTGGGFTTLFPAGTTLPLASTSNFSAGQTRANNAIPPLNGVGDLSIFCGMGVGQTVDVIIDVAGYFQ